MAQQFDYTLNVQQPFQAALQGYQTGAAIRDDQVKQQQQQQLALQQQTMRTDFADLAANPNATPADYAAITLKHPQFAAQIKQASEMMGAEKRQNTLQPATQAYAALASNRPDIAKQVLTERAQALRNSGDEAGAKHLDVWSGIIDSNPVTARNMIGVTLAAADDKFAGSMAALGGEQRASDKAPADLARANADAATAGVKAKYAEPEAVLDLEKKGWDITALKADIGFKREQNRIAAMNAAIGREGNDLKRQELVLKVQEKQTELNDRVRAKAADAESGAATIDNFLNTIERIKTSKGLPDVLGAVEGSGAYPNTLAGIANTFNPVGGSSADERANAIALIETLGSQAFLSQIPAMKGQGALSNAEGEKLQSALTNLSRKQSETQFKANLDEAARIMKKARENLAAKTGVPLGKPDTPAAPGTRPPLSSFQK